MQHIHAILTGEPIGDCQNGDLRVHFERTLKLRFLGSKATTDAGLLAYRELDEALGLTEMGDEAVEDLRLGRNKQHGLVPLLRQSICSRLAGYVGGRLAGALSAGDNWGRGAPEKGREVCWRSP